MVHPGKFDPTCSYTTDSPAPDVPPAAWKNPESVLATLTLEIPDSVEGERSAFSPDLFCYALAIVCTITLPEPAPAA